MFSTTGDLFKWRTGIILMNREVELTLTILFYLEKKLIHKCRFVNDVYSMEICFCHEGMQSIT